MGEPHPAETERHPPPSPPRALAWTAWLCLAIGIISAGYYLYDIASPGPDVGEMYGLVSTLRLAMLALPSGLLVVCFAGTLLRPVRRRRWLRSVLTVLLVAATVVLVFLAADAAKSRRQRRVRETYPLKSTDELLRIARADKDTFAVYELLIRKDQAAVPGLREILFDDDESPDLRSSAAHALGAIGGEAARAALERIQRERPHPTVTAAAEHALEFRMGRKPPSEQP